MKFKSKNLQTKSEATFFQCLKQAFPDHYIAPQVAMSAIVESVEYKDRSQFRNYYVDYVICDADAVKPLLVIELDDPSHARKKAQERDARKNTVLHHAGIPLFRVTGENHSPKSIFESISPILTGKVPPPQYEFHKLTASKNENTGCMPIILALALIPIYLLMYLII